MEQTHGQEEDMGVGSQVVTILQRDTLLLPRAPRQA